MDSWERNFNKVILLRGLEIQRNKKIVLVNNYDKYISALVTGDSTYEAFVEFDKNKKLINVGCECFYHDNVTPYCKHVAALLYHIEDAELLYSKINVNYITSKFFDIFDNIKKMNKVYHSNNKQLIIKMTKFYKEFNLLTSNYIIRNYSDEMEDTCLEVFKIILTNLIEYSENKYYDEHTLIVILDKILEKLMKRNSLKVYKIFEEIKTSFLNQKALIFGLIDLVMEKYNKNVSYEDNKKLIQKLKEKQVGCDVNLSSLYLKNIIIFKNKDDYKIDNKIYLNLNDIEKEKYIKYLIEYVDVDYALYIIKKYNNIGADSFSKRLLILKNDAFRKKGQINFDTLWEQIYDNKDITKEAYIDLKNLLQYKEFEKSLLLIIKKYKKNDTIEKILIDDKQYDMLFKYIIENDTSSNNLFLKHLSTLKKVKNEECIRYIKDDILKNKILGSISEREDIAITSLMYALSSIEKSEDAIKEIINIIKENKNRKRLIDFLYSFM